MEIMINLNFPPIQKMTTEHKTKSKTKHKTTNPRLHLNRHIAKILSLKLSGFTWDEIAIEFNHALNLKGSHVFSGKTLLKSAVKWKEEGLIDLKKVELHSKKMKFELECYEKEHSTSLSRIPTPRTPSDIDNQATSPSHH
ncbi:MULTISPECIES: hypothetical protein [Burkholderia]|uniref:hypothetical protein n=1 Tax=Burkholderia TaxID=32008 RepID=UPI001374341F|nr:MULTISPECIES: hypothetical protein [Burkholderia]QHP90290.1 hypothetical protein EXE55_04665 [Burkholderia glumae]UIY55603.1 hypothetical protein LZ568_12240 [Burkholderia cepacia]